MTTRLGGIAGLGAALFAFACSQSPSWKITFDSSAKTTASERADTAAKLMRAAPPSLILDADFREESAGDGGLGPSDRRLRMRIRVSPKKIGAWRAAAGAQIPLAAQPASFTAADWWPSRFDPADFYFLPASAFFHAANGWVAVPKKNGEFLYFFVFSM